MGNFVKGDVVVLPFPFSDLTGSKRRPSLVLTQLRGDDVILCQITAQSRGDGYSIPLAQTDFASGSLNQPLSNVRPNRLFTADSNIIAYCAGKLSKAKTDEVINKVIEIIET
jgi:mRNA interferase MazF